MQGAVQVGRDDGRDRAGLAALDADRRRCLGESLGVGGHELGDQGRPGKPHARMAGTAEVMMRPAVTIDPALNVLGSLPSSLQFLGRPIPRVCSRILRLRLAGYNLDLRPVD